jgi:hypothetical protein
VEETEDLQLFIRRFSRPSPRHLQSFSLRLIVTVSLAIELAVEMTLRSADLLECFCGRTYTHATDLEEHRRARGHFSSHTLVNKRAGSLSSVSLVGLIDSIELS